MICNGTALLKAAPIKNMLDCKVERHGVSHGLSEVGYDIRIKQEITFQPFWQRGSNAAYPPQARILIGDQTGWTPGRFTLASAIEQFDMPANLAGVVHDKSSWARKGLSVFNTIIEPGWKGYLTLELVYHGAEPLHIPAGAGIAQVVFHQILEAAHYDGKYQNQADRPVEAIAR